MVLHHVRVLRELAPSTTPANAELVVQGLASFLLLALDFHLPSRHSCVTTAAHVVRL
jgi:hypothetical protein